MTKITSKLLMRRSVCAWLGSALVAAPVAAQKPFTVWEPLPTLPDAQLLDHKGRSVRFVRDMLQNRVFVLNFIFTGCTTVCPPQTALLKQARNELQASAGSLVWLSLSVDPLSDTPAMLDAYREKFAISANAIPWHFLTGEPNTVAHLRAVWGDKTRNPGDHLSRLIVGSAAAHRYTSMDAFSSPHAVVQRVQELLL